MGHSYTCIVAFGVIIPIKRFVEVFPDSFELIMNQPGKGYQANDEIMEEMTESHDVDFHYEQHDKPGNVFVCSTKNLIEDVRGACGRHQLIDITELQSQEELFALQTFIMENFPEEKNINLTMFSYEGA